MMIAQVYWKIAKFLSSNWAIVEKRWKAVFLFFSFSFFVCLFPFYKSYEYPSPSPLISIKANDETIVIFMFVLFIFHSMGASMKVIFPVFFCFPSDFVFRNVGKKVFVKIRIN